MAPPANDAFASASAISGATGTISGTVFDATYQSTEPTSLGNSSIQSVWYTYTAPSTGQFKFWLPWSSHTYHGTQGSDYTWGNIAVIPTGALTAMTSTNALSYTEKGGAYPAGAEAGDASVLVNLTSGSVYYIKVWAISTGNTYTFDFVLQWSDIPTIAPANDLYANRIDLGSIPVSETLNTTYDAGFETSETVFGSKSHNQSVWYSFTPSSTGSYRFKIPEASINYAGSYLGSTIPNYVQSYVQIGTGTPSSFTTLESIAINSDITYDQYRYLSLTSGTEYKIRVIGEYYAKQFTQLYGYNTNVWEFDLEIDTAPSAPANDNFASAEVLSGDSGSTPGTNLMATKEGSEPTLFSANEQSVWYKITPSTTGQWNFTIEAADIEYVGDLVPINASLIMCIFNETADTLAECDRNHNLPISFTQETWSFGGGDMNMNVQLFSGNTYYIKVMSNAGSAVDNNSVCEWILQWELVTANPANDALVDAISLGTPPDTITAQTTFNATSEVNEVQRWYPYGEDQGVWYEFTPSTTQQYRFFIDNLTAHSISTQWRAGLQLYSGSSHPLTVINYTSGFSDPTGPLAVRSPLNSGTSYKLRVDAPNYDFNNFRTYDFDISVAAISSPGIPPANDNIADVQDLGTDPGGTTSGSTIDATWETWEEDGGYNQPSTWYKFTITNSDTQRVQLTKTGTDPDWQPYAEIYGVLNDPPADFDDLDYYEYIGNDFQDGTIAYTDISWTPGDYYMVVYNWNFDGSWDDYEINFVVPPPTPVNDTFPNRIVEQTSYKVCETGTTAGATAQTGVDFNEPNTNPGAHSPAYPSVWYEWEAPNYNRTPLNYIFDCLGSPAGAATDLYLELFTGSSVGALTLINSNRNSGAGGKPQFTQSIVGGTNYKIRVSSPASNWGTFNLNIAAQVGGSPPANDTFANAILMTGYSDSESGTTAGASAECGEPTWGIFEESTTNTVWYKWVPPQTGRVRIQIDSGTGTFGTAVFLARGTSLSTLQRVTDLGISTGGSPEYDYVTVEGGVDYYFIVQGNGGYEDTFTLSFEMANVSIPANNDPANATVIPAVTGTATITDNTEGSFFDAVGEDIGDFITNAQQLSTIFYKLQPDRFGSINLHVNNDVVFNNDDTRDAFIHVLRGSNIATAVPVTSPVYEGSADHQALLVKDETYWIVVESYYWSTTLSWTYQIQLEDENTQGYSPSPANGTGDFASITGTFNADDEENVFTAGGGVGYGTLTFPEGHHPYGWWTRFEVESSNGEYLYRYGQTQQFIEFFRATRTDTTYESIGVLGHYNGTQTIAYFQNGTLRYDTEHVVWSLNKYGSTSKVRIEAGVNGLTIDGVNFFIPFDGEGFVDSWMTNQFVQFDYGIITYPGDGTSYVPLDPEWDIRISDLTLHDNPEIGVMGPADPLDQEITSIMGWTGGELIGHSSWDGQFTVLGNTGASIHNPPTIVASAGEYSDGYSLDCTVTSSVGDALYPCGIGMADSQPTDSLQYDPYGDPAYDSDYNGISFRFYIHDDFPAENLTIATHITDDLGDLEGWNLVLGTDGTLYIRPSQDSGLIPFCYVNVNEWCYIELQEDVHSVPYAVNIWMQGGVFIGRFEATFVSADTSFPGVRRRQYALGRLGDDFLTTGFFSDIQASIEFRDVATTRAKQHRPLGPTIVIGKNVNGTGEHYYPDHVEGTLPTVSPFSFNGDFSGGADGAGQPHYWTGYDRHDTAPAGAMKLDYLFSQVENSTVSLTTDGSGPPGMEGDNAMQVVAINNACQVAYVFGGGTSPATDVIFPYEYADTISFHGWMKGPVGQVVHLEAESGIGGWFPDNYITLTGAWQYVRLFLLPQNFSGFTHNLTGLLITFDSSVTGDTFLIKGGWFYLNADNNWVTFYQSTDNGSTHTIIPFDDDDSWELIDEFPPTIEGDHVYAATSIFLDNVRGAEDDGKTHLPPMILSSYLEYTFEGYNPPDGEKVFGAKLLLQCKDYQGASNNESDANFAGYGGRGPVNITIANEDGDYRAIGGRHPHPHIDSPNESRFGITMRRPPGLGEWTINKWNSFRIRFGHHNTLFANSSHWIGDYTNAGVLESAYVELLTYDRRLPPPHCVRPVDLSRIRYRPQEDNDVGEE